MKEFYWNGRRAMGQASLLEHPRRAILNSSQGKQPRGTDVWVEMTSRAVLEGDPCSVLLTSLGMNTWELVTFLASREGVPQICLVPTPEGSSFETICTETVDEFGMDWNHVCFLEIPFEGKSPKKGWEERDRTALSLANVLYPVSIRGGGRLSSRLRNLPAGVAVCEDYRTGWVPSLSRKPYRIDRERIEKEIDREHPGWLFHWTRASDGPWPGERRKDYYRDVLASGNEYTRSAKKTLARIVSERKIRGSSWRIRGGSRVVCFSGLRPSEASDLFTWRRRYARFRAEPYGVAVHPDAAQQEGIRPVSYLESDAPVRDVPRFLQQGTGKSASWPREREHRCEGDLDLSRLPNGSWHPIALPLLA